MATGSHMRVIALEEHFASPGFMAGPGRELTARLHSAQAGDLMAGVVERLVDLDTLRIAEMDEAGIDTQVLSLTSPGTEQLDARDAITLAREVNDVAAEAVRRHPGRFVALAALPTAAPDAAVQELARAVRDLGCAGAVINGHIGARYLDDPFFWPIFEQAQTLGVPIYLHPTPPPEAVIAASYTGNFSPAVTAQLAAAGWGWHIETATHILRIILAGVFDRYPKLQLIVGHLGEALPFMLERLNRSMPPPLTRLERPIGDYLRENLHYTFSGFNFLPPYLNLMLEVGVERIMFSVDYPYSSMEHGRQFLERLPVSPHDRERIAHGNAERLLALT